MEQSRIVGRVLSVDNFRVFIKIEDDLRGTYKSGIEDIYEVARINSYLIIPVGSDRVVALITRVTMKEELEFDKNSTSITLPTSARYISATMLGTIAKKDQEEKYIQGVYNFPTLDNPVWYVTEKDLRHIFDDKQDNANIDYSQDFYLPVGNSPAFIDFRVKICPDQLFVKHAAILGNTGSGKSCTFTSIIRNLFKFPYGEKKLENAHVIIFDTNGEYREAFLPGEKIANDLDKKDLEELKLINAYYYGGDEKVKVPYWLMNWHDFRNLLHPSDGTQAPVLNRAIGLAKNEEESLKVGAIPNHLRADIDGILNNSTEELKKRTWDAGGNWKWKAGNEIISIGEAIKKYSADIGDAVIELANEVNFNDAKKQDPIRVKISTLLQSLENAVLEEQITSEQNIDLPIWFSYKELCTKFLDAAIAQEGRANNRIAEFVSTLRLRMNSFLNDKRMAIPLMLKDTNQFNKEILPEFLSFILGDFNAHFSKTSKDSFLKEYNSALEVHSKDKSHQITIVDVSQLPFEVL
ncbi:MAG: DUF87 domain-containing protein, partial [Verrucomicrobiota bacterium]|nr:DUF87 domain-containing protein [Verrucomicrobiota bacterium]